jgi:HD-like signal output (HDOD) protein
MDREIAGGQPVARLRPTGQAQTMDESAAGQLDVIRKVIGVMRAADISAWLFGGWGLDARIGRITRAHGDVEFWVEHRQAQRSKALLVEAGALPLSTQPPAESCEFTWDGVPFSTGVL